MKRARDGTSATGVEALKSKMIERANRIQGQITFQDGPTGLGLVVGVYRDGTHCTNVISAWLCAIMHPVDGLPDYKATQREYDAIPMYAHKRLVAKTSHKNSKQIRLQDELELIYNIGDECAKKERPLIEKLHPHHARLVSKYWKGDMVLKSPPFVFLKHVCAPRGAMVFYHGFHFNVSCAEPKVVMHLDYLPFEPTLEAAQVLSKVYEERSVKSIANNRGRSNYCDLENEYYGITGMPGLPVSPLAETVLGGKSWNSFMASHPLYLGVISHSDLKRKQLHEQGYLVVDPEVEWADDSNLESYRLYVKEALAEFERFFNWVLFKRLGRSEHLSFENRGDKLWDIMRSQEECEKQMGNKHFLNLATKNQDGVWVHDPVTRGGAGCVTKSSGMGHATNFMRGYAMNCLSCHPYVVMTFQKLYDHIAVHNCAERWRVKCGTGDPASDKVPRDNIMPIHIDIKPTATGTLRTEVAVF